MRTNSIGITTLVILKWAFLFVSFLIIAMILLPWLGVSLPVYSTNSTVSRVNSNPVSYIPIVVVIMPTLVLATWPGPRQLYRCVAVATIYFGLGLAVGWSMDGGMGNMLWFAALGVLNFGVMQERARRWG
jgi:hypothetical protein